jgi:hypothetical protein
MHVMTGSNHKGGAVPDANRGRNSVLGRHEATNAVELSASFSRGPSHGLSAEGNLERCVAKPVSLGEEPSAQPAKAASLFVAAATLAPPRLIRRARVGQQHFQRVKRASAHSLVQCGVARGISRARAGAESKQRRERSCVSLVCSHLQWRHGMRIGRVGIGTRGAEQFDAFNRARCCSSKNGRRTVLLALLHIRT